MWVVNPKYVRSNHEAFLSLTADQRKAHAVKAMALYDKLPKKAREAVNEYGQLPAAAKCRSRRAADKVNAVLRAYNRKLALTATRI